MPKIPKVNDTAPIALKTVVLYNQRKIRPQTLRAICDAAPGAMIPVDESELNSFMPLTVFLPADLIDKADLVEE